MTSPSTHAFPSKEKKTAPTGAKPTGCTGQCSTVRLPYHRTVKTVPSYAHATLVSNVVLDVAKKSIKPVIMVRCRGIENLEILPTPEYTNNGVLLTLTIRDGLSRIPHYKESESELSPHHTVFLPSVL